MPRSASSTAARFAWLAEVLTKHEQSWPSSWLSVGNGYSFHQGIEWTRIEGSRMKFSELKHGDTLKMVGGQKAVILCTDARGQFPIIGFIAHATGDEPASWTREGRFLKHKESKFDLLALVSDSCDGK